MDKDAKNSGKAEETATDNISQEMSEQGNDGSENLHNGADDSNNQANEYLQLLQRTQADFENFRRRSRQEKEETLKYGAYKLVENLLPVLDNFERAINAEGQDLENFLSGVTLILKQLKDVLQKEGVTPIEAVGSEFDPNQHEAVMGVESPEHSDNTVIEEFQKGYYYHDKVVRPSMVKVAKNS